MARGNTTPWLVTRAPSLSNFDFYCRIRRIWVLHANWIRYGEVGELVVRFNEKHKWNDRWWAMSSEPACGFKLWWKGSSPVNFLWDQTGTGDREKKSLVGFEPAPRPSGSWTGDLYHSAIRSMDRTTLVWIITYEWYFISYAIQTKFAFISG